ncbi:ATP-binding protein [Ectopseudomonas mendocina]|uniref:histidine kinase n=1 Tax=Ectopseudomonas mendocina TaxID=300 RepID=A0ABZ2RGD6_ECTME
MSNNLSLNQEQSWRVLRLYHIYRVGIGMILALLVSSNLDTELLELAHPTLFRNGSWIYLALNILIIALVQRPKQLAQIFTIALADVLFLTGLFYTAGGVPSGIGSLLIVSVAIANILLSGRIGLLIAAVAAIGMVYLTFYLSLDRPAATSQYVQAGALGALCFGTALFVQRLTLRLQASETLAEQRAADVASLETLNALILQRMRTGILVLDESHRILLANHGAEQLLGQSALEGQRIDTVCPQLINRMKQWLLNPSLRPGSIQPPENGHLIQPSFTPLQRGSKTHTLIFLDDVSQITQQAQQLKLASLGRLTAGIAHEIRNPLGAISHAAQLLQESEDLQGPDRRLAQIIHDHTQRMDLVIENVLQLSRRRQAEPQLLDLKYWLHRFASEFRSSAAADQTLHLNVTGGSIQTRMDPNQLTQVLSNLVSNGLRYSSKKNRAGQVWLNLYRDEESDLPILEILDDGPGIAPEQISHLFEPFFTTESKGTGLGLYISRELCESNQARLDYKEREGGGSCFRITFAHPRKLS